MIVVAYVVGALICWPLFTRRAVRWNVEQFSCLYEAGPDRRLLVESTLFCLFLAAIWLPYGLPLAWGFFGGFDRIVYGPREDRP